MACPGFSPWTISARIINPPPRFPPASPITVVTGIDACEMFLITPPQQ
ncbi:hypothetical protein PR003_g3025 [Phytophthora rubi]|uniref:Uncharacterized protein n=1 Tax=Phytophthora rubi TaxID=129364 RepID=A0A6A4FWM4_9STRA|nr:hypothetical protein PR001_g8846 [Phytophthora rubi]KAE9043867.1 hypothetical protein PR002_g3114 [Phytophthora rubi]KAE9355080.1 hypothetical protein PR003_g3025 [Phytophthora rubi]